MRQAAAPPDLSALSQADLQNLIARAQALLPSGPQAQPAGGERPEQEVLAALLDLLRDRGSRLPEGVIRRGPYWSAFRSAAPAIADYLREYAPSVAGKRVLRCAAYRRLLSVLARWLDRLKVPVTPKTMIQNMPKVPALMEQQFPGYATSGLLEWVFKSR